MLDFRGYEIVADGIDAGRYATPEVAMQAYVDDCHSYISDTSKDVWGFRYRGALPTTFAELEEECKIWEDRLNILLSEEQHEEIENLNAFIQYAPDLETAERWAKEATH